MTDSHSGTRNSPFAYLCDSCVKQTCQKSSLHTLSTLQSDLNREGAGGYFFLNERTTEPGVAIPKTQHIVLTLPSVWIYWIRPIMKIRRRMSANPLFFWYHQDDVDGLRVDEQLSTASMFPPCDFLWRQRFSVNGCPFTSVRWPIECLYDCLLSVVRAAPVLICAHKRSLFCTSSLIDNWLQAFLAVMGITAETFVLKGQVSRLGLDQSDDRLTRRSGRMVPVAHHLTLGDSVGMKPTPMGSKSGSSDE